MSTKEPTLSCFLITLTHIYPPEWLNTLDITSHCIQYSNYKTNNQEITLSCVEIFTGQSYNNLITKSLRLMGHAETSSDGKMEWEVVEHWRGKRV